MKKVKEIMAEMLTEWLFRDFGLLIDEPTQEDIEKKLEEYKEEPHNESLVTKYGSRILDTLKNHPKKF